MCDICEKAKGSDEYKVLLDKMLEDDKARLEFSREMVETIRPIARGLLASVKWPVKLVFPMFEARAPMSVPQNYFQPIMIDGERLGNMFSHGSMRSLFFWGENLVVFSKSVNHREGKEFFTSFVLAHFAPGEFSTVVDGENVTIKVDMEKSFRNLLSGGLERRRIAFNFTNSEVRNRIVTKEQVMTSSQFKSVYGKYGGATLKSASIDMEGYAITVPHFSPHPYMLQLKERFGYESNRQFQENVMKDYFLKHLK
jgi:hypothetical protein